ncbi:MAG: nucleoside recognition protein [Defluviitaleaceae bacterium]|nr:nucleoside recognition protein [Defluviitaleaceae bacterium]
MIILGIVVSSFTGNLTLITSASIDSARSAVELIVSMVGIICMWTGLMKIAEKSGLIDSISQKIMPLLKFLFPDVPKNSKAMLHISTNLIANALGLGWAATPAGIMAMKELQKLNTNKKVASKSMCMFLIVNMSSLQIISVAVVADRSAYDSLIPSDILAPALIVTIVTSIVGVLAAKILEVFYK